MDWMHEAPPLEILIVEDNPGEILLAQEAWKAADAGVRLHMVTDGPAAMAFLRKEAPYPDAVRPALILLDLNLPNRPGMAVLAELKGDDSFKQIPVIILSTSEDERDIATAYAYHANCYVTKPMDLKKYFDVIRNISNFWIFTATLPQG